MLLLLCGLPVYLCHGWITVDEMQKHIKMSREDHIRWGAYLQKVEYEAEIGWCDYYHVFPNLINSYGLKKGVEIGVSTGGHSDAILKRTNVEKLYSIDPWLKNPSLGMPHPVLFEMLYLRVAHRLQRYGKRSYILRDYSYKVTHLFDERSLDFVFVDGDHNYEAVKKDLEMWFPKVRTGGIIGGDDYATSWPGVPKAVNEFFAAKGLVVHQDKEQPRIWWVQKI